MSTLGSNSASLMWRLEMTRSMPRPPAVVTEDFPSHMHVLVSNFACGP